MYICIYKYDWRHISLTVSLKAGFTFDIYNTAHHVTRLNEIRQVSNSNLPTCKIEFTRAICYL